MARSSRSVEDDPGPVFYVDEDLDCVPFVAPLLEAGFRIVRHRETGLGAGAADDIWIPFVAERRWLAFTHDKGILSHHRQCRLLLDHDLGLFVVRGKTQSLLHTIMAQNVVDLKATIDRWAAKNFAPYIASVKLPDKDGARGKVDGRWPRDRVWGKGKMEARRQRR